MKNSRSVWMLGAGAAASLLGLASTAQAQGTPQAVHFPRGATSVTLEGEASSAGRVYTFNARRGQTISITLHSRADDVSADLVQGRADIGATNREGELVEQVPATGRYTVRVYRPAGGRGTSHYAMDLSVR